jgi:hypothetical protein
MPDGMAFAALLDGDRTMSDEPHPESAGAAPDRAAPDSPPAASPSPASHVAATGSGPAAIFRKPAPPNDAPGHPVVPSHDEPEPTREGFSVQPFDALLVTAALVVVAILGYVYLGRQASSGLPAPRSIVAARSGVAPVPAGSPAVTRTGGADQTPSEAPDTISAPPGSVATMSNPEAEETTPRLQLVGLRCRREDGSNVIEGAVRNATTEPLPQVLVVGTWGAADGRVVKTDDAPVKDDPIPPRQTTSFRVSIPEESAVTLCQVAFRTFGGGPIPWVDVRQR